MEETRVKKYKEYRDSMIKEDAISIETVRNSENSHTRKALDTSTTSALPISQVMGVLEEDQEEQAFKKKRKKQTILKIALIVVAAMVTLALLIIFGILAFGRN